MKQQPQCARLLPNPHLSPNLLHLKDKLASIDRSKDVDQVEAVVAILLWDEPGRGLQTLLVQRAEREGDPWSGQIGLPGGRVKQGAETPRTALHREVEEEVGIKLEEVGVELGSLSVGHPMRRLEMRVHPLHLACLAYFECRWLSAGLARLQMRWCEIWFREGSKSEHRSVCREGHTWMSQLQLIQDSPKLIPQSFGHVGTRGGLKLQILGIAIHDNLSLRNLAQRLHPS